MLPWLYFLSMGWSFFGRDIDSPLKYIMAPAAFVVFYPALRMQEKGYLKHLSGRRLILEALGAVALALTLVAPYVPIHDWLGHITAYHLFWKPPAGGVIKFLWTSLLQGDYQTPAGSLFSPYFSAWRNLSDDQVNFWIDAAGTFAAMAYAGTLLFLSLFMKRWRSVRGGLRLAALGVGFFGLQYVRGSAMLGGDTDWAKIWGANVSPLAKNLMTLLVWLFPYMTAVWTAVAQRNEWLRLRPAEGAINPLNAQQLWGARGYWRHECSV